MSNIIDKIQVSGVTYDISGGGIPESAFTAYTAATDSRISEDEEVTSAGINALNGKFDTKVDASTYSAYTAATDTALSGKQTTLTAGTGIDITDNVISATGGGGKAVEGGRGITVTTGETADTVSFNLPISAGTGSNSIICNHNKNKATGSYSFAGGQESSATSFWSFAYGANCKANYGSWAGGYQCLGNGSYSFAIGERTKTSNGGECAVGSYNASNIGSTNADNTLFSVGNGTANNARHNAFEIRQNGDIYITSGGTDIKLQDNIGGGVSESVFTAYTASTDSRIAEDEEVTAAGLNAVNDKFDGLKLQQITQSDYNNLQTKDPSTLYIIVN